MSTFYGLAQWVHDMDLLDRARWGRVHRPWTGFNPWLERVADGR